MAAVLDAFGFSSEPAYDATVPELEEPAGIARRMGLPGYLFADIPDPPCVTCEHSQRCASERMACSGFVSYVSGANNQRPDVPLRDWYGPLLGGEIACQRLVFADRVPT